jgi:hypothetical protein
MKKILLSTSAIVGVGLLAMPAMAQAKKVQLAVGGYMEQYVGYADADRKKTASFDLTKWDQQSDSEVYFSGSTKLDNGITFSAMVELEGDESSGGTIDESYLRIVSPTMGELRLGGDDAVDAIMVVQANRGISGDYDNWVVEAGSSKNDNLYDGASSDVNKVSYFTPKIAGFQAGVSFANTTTGSAVDPANYATTTVGGPLWAGAATYETKLADVGIKLGASMSKLSNSKVATGRTNYTGGAQLSYQAFSVSGGYAKTDQNLAPTNATIDNLDGDRYQIGVQYATGPYTVGLWHMNDTHEGLTSITKDDKTKVYAAYGEYVLSDGVKLQGLVFKVDYDHEVDAAANQLGGWGVVTGFRLDF